MPPSDSVEPSGDREMAVELKRRLFTIEEFQRMGEVGILDEDERVDPQKSAGGLDIKN